MAKIIYRQAPGLGFMNRHFYGKLMEVFSDLTMAERAILTILGGYSGEPLPDQTFVCWPKQSRLADQLGISDSTMTRSMASMSSRGLIDVARIGKVRVLKVFGKFSKQETEEMACFGASFLEEWKRTMIMTGDYERKAN